MSTHPAPPSPDTTDRALTAVMDIATDGWMLLAPLRADGRCVDFVVVHLNPAGRVSTNIQLSEAAVGRPVTEVFPLVAQVGLLDRYRDVLRSGRRQQTHLWYDDGRARGDYDVEVLRVGTHGNYRVAVRFANQTAALLAEARHESDARLRRALDSALDGFILLTPVRDDAGTVGDWVVDYVNRAGLAAIGRSTEDVVGTRVSVTFPQAESLGLGDAYATVLETGIPLTREVDYEDDRVRAAFELQCVRLGTGVAVSFRDVSERSRQRRLVEASELRSRAAATRSDILRAVATELSQASTVADVTAVMWRWTRAGLGGDTLLVSLLNDEDRLEAVRADGYDERLLRFVRLLDLTAPLPQARAAASGEPLFLASPAQYLAAFPGATQVVEASGMRAWAVLPLLASGRVLGSWLTGYATEYVADADDRGLLVTLASLYAQALARAQLFEAQRDTATVLQSALLPGELGHPGGVGVAAHYRPAGLGLEVGGDFYDVIDLPGGGVAVVMGDVAGHGVGAAAVMGMIRTALRAYALEGHGPAGVLARVNRMLSVYEPDQIATCCYLELRPDQSAVTVVLAGHPAPALAGPHTRLLEAEVSLPLGVADDADFAETTLLLPPDGVVLLYTDGLVETPAQPITTGQQRLLEVLTRTPDLDPDPLVAAVLDGLLGNARVRDDVALLAVRPVTGSSHRGAPVSRSYPAEPASVSAARGFVTDVLGQWRLEMLADDAALLVSELVTNAVLHTPEPLEVAVRLDGAHLRVEVTDLSDRVPELRDVDDEATSGRGLFIVEVLAEAWGSEPHGAGKRVWFTLPVPAGH